MVRVDAFAKLTLSLRVLGTRDGGYHELDAFTVSVTEPHDHLTITPAEETSIAIDGPFARDVPADASNLAWQAADALGARVSIALRKGIPSGAGLGGGSTDAAAVLVACGKELDVDLSAIAATLGADVPFCLDGGAARMRGVGDVLEPAEVPLLSIVVITPPFGCATAEVYRAWDALGGPSGTEVDSGDARVGALVNDLEPAAHHVEPRLVTFRDAVERAGQRTPILAGSGSSYALLFRDAGSAEDARARLEATVEGSVFVGRTTDAGVALVR
jgi:4-diphosphocytidyl-2-C-methyl-D-erythritol kinase